MTRDELISKLLSDLGVKESDENVEIIEKFIVDEANLPWNEAGNKTLWDELRRAESEEKKLRIALGVALKELGELRGK